jgi:hypothetical protein
MSKDHLPTYPSEFKEKDESRLKTTIKPVGGSNPRVGNFIFIGVSVLFVALIGWLLLQVIPLIPETSFFAGRTLIIATQDDQSKSSISSTQIPGSNALISPQSAEPSLSNSSLELDTHLYRDQKGLFQFYPPLGWAIDQGVDIVTFKAPDDPGKISFQVTNTGTKLDGDAFQRFVEAREINTFSQYDKIDNQNAVVEIDKASATARLVKGIRVNNTPFVVSTFYKQFEQAIVNIDFWSSPSDYPSRSNQYEKIVTSLIFNNHAAANLVTYSPSYTFHSRDNLFTMDIPTSWKYTTVVGTYTHVDTFYSPDQNAVIQTIIYDDGKGINRSLAGAFALSLLRNYYAQDNVTITEDRLLPDGSERLIWNYPKGGYQGVFYFVLKGSSLVLYGGTFHNDSLQAFEDVNNRILASLHLSE